MSKIVFCNEDTKKIIYSGYTISKVYACGGELVYSAETGPDCSTPMPDDLWKVKFQYKNGETAYILKGNNTTASTSDYANYVTKYCDGQVIYEYRDYYRDINNIEIVTTNKNTTYIGDGFISGSTSLKDVNLHNCESRTDIGEYAFANCTSLSEIILCNTVKTIGAFAFFKTSSLHSIYITSGVTSIGDAAFLESKLIWLRMGGSVPPTLGRYVFLSSELNSISVPIGSVETYQNAQGWSEYADIIQSH